MKAWMHGCLLVAMVGCATSPDVGDVGDDLELDLSPGDGADDPADDGSTTGPPGEQGDDDGPPDPPDDPPTQPPDDPPDDNNGLGTGPSDWTASMACDLFDQGSQETVQAASRFGQASQALITPSENTVYTINRASGDGYLVIEVPDWHVELRVFAEPGTSYEVLDTGGSNLLSLNGACPADGITDQTWLIHDWGTYVVRIDDSSPNPVQLAVIQID